MGIRGPVGNLRFSNCEIGSYIGVVGSFSGFYEKYSNFNVVSES